MNQGMEGDARPHPIWYLVIVVAAGLSSVAVALFVKGGLGDIQRLRERKQQLIEAKKQRRKQLRTLRQREVRLHQDPYLIERLARQKLGLKRPGEIRVRVGDVPDTSVSYHSDTSRDTGFNTGRTNPDE